MALRTARKGPHAGEQFWGCTGYPECKGTRACKGQIGSDGDDRFDRSDGSRRISRIKSRGKHEHHRPIRTRDPEPGDCLVPR
ncbi:hypothetical protein [Methanothrix soehngenii]|uniref:hypothetical protein n=1 Tax=Methanothrix soehngenii TaxID=2223 RepID=UPI003AB95BA4